MVPAAGVVGRGRGRYRAQPPSQTASSVQPQRRTLAKETTRAGFFTPGFYRETGMAAQCLPVSIVCSEG